MASLNDDLFLATREGNVENIKKLLSLGADPNFSKKFVVQSKHIGFKPLMVAIHYDHIECAEILIKAGADINAKDQANDRSALMFAASASHINGLKWLKLLLDYHANIELEDHLGRTALFFSCHHSPSHLPSICYLLDRGANIDHQDLQKRTAIMTMLVSTIPFGVSKLDAFALMLEKGANVDISDHQGNTIMSIAKNDRNRNPAIYECLVAFLEKKALVGNINHGERTNLVEAAESQVFGLHF